MGIDHDTEISVQELSAILGISERRIYQLIQDDIIEPISRGKYPLCRSIQGYIDFIRREPVTEEEKESERERRKAETSLKVSKAKIAQLEAAELEGKMHRSEDVEAMTADLIFAIRGALLALPGRLAVDIVAVQTAAEAAELVKKEVYAIMQEIAQYRYDPEKYAERVRERMNWSSDPVLT